MIYIIIALIIVLVILAARLFFLRREINRLTKNLKELNAGDTRQKLTVKMTHQPLEDLCEQINNEIDIRIDAQKHEPELRNQISNISHDLRTPLTAILGYISLAKNSPGKEAAYLETIESRSKALQSLVEQFYELSLIEDTFDELILQPVDVTEALTDCLLGHFALFEKKSIEPKTYLPEQSLMIISNAQALERIFQNLLENALKFATHSIEISLTDDSKHCVFTISNDAESLAETDVNRLFERFYTADRSRIDGNTGLGLYIVKRLLEKTQGSVGSVSLANGRFTIEVLFAKTSPSE